MSQPDLNLLLTLDVLLAEGSVAAAARRLRLSPSAMSRALARLREATGDPLLVRAGSKLVPSPRALELRERVAQLVRDADDVLRPAHAPDLSCVVRTFTILCSDGFVESFGATLIARVNRDAPGLRLRFIQKVRKGSAPLRDGSVDLETGVAGTSTSPEIRTRMLFDDRFVGVVRPGHPLARGKPSAERYAAARHVLVSRRELERGVIDDALAAHGMRRDIATIVSGFGPAIALARDSDLVATVPEKHTRALRDGMHTFALPVALREMTISMLWHPRMDGDSVHAWVRACVREACDAA
ncbi:MAG: Nodulation protein D 2 [Luteibacter sp.]|uniref:LysR family transcriptional regulator n=1 Tax=Luteibacter sp. TaxID=1886636 RepID=UPI00137F4012|nr:LysR family transcriptional regulator [Luteibacter sp.]KAF1004739.1 MAG: Nodulation protein D 2 [Luteibacter sp.]